MTYNITPARKEQASEIAELIMTAMTHECCLYFCSEGYGIDDFRKMMTMLVESENSQYSYKNAIVATDADHVVGVSVSYDGDKLHQLRAAFIEAAKKYLEQRGDDGIPELFVNSEGRPATAGNLYEWVVDMRPILKELTGTEYLCNVHSFRHSALENYSTGTHQHLIDNGMGALPIEKLRLIARHSSIATTQRYLAPKDDKELEDLFGIKID